MKFLRASDAEGILHAVTEFDPEPLCKRTVRFTHSITDAGTFWSSHPSACPDCVAAVKQLRGDPEQSDFDPYAEEGAALPADEPTQE